MISMRIYIIIGIRWISLPAAGVSILRLRLPTLYLISATEPTVISAPIPFSQRKLRLSSNFITYVEIPQAIFGAASRGDLVSPGLMHPFGETFIAACPGRPPEQFTDNMCDAALYWDLLPQCLLADPGLFIEEKKGSLCADCDTIRVGGGHTVLAEYFYVAAYLPAILPVGFPKYIHGHSFCVAILDHVLPRS